MTRLLKSGGGQGTREIYWATNSCMDLKSKCNHYRWESLDVAKSSYLEPFKSCLADRCFKQRNKSIRDWRPDRESSVLLISFGSSFLFFFFFFFTHGSPSRFMALIYVFFSASCQPRITPVCKQSIIFFLYKMNAPLCLECVF